MVNYDNQLLDVAPYLTNRHDSGIDLLIQLFKAKQIFLKVLSCSFKPKPVQKQISDWLILSFEFDESYNNHFSHCFVYIPSVPNNIRSAHKNDV